MSLQKLECQKIVKNEEGIPVLKVLVITKRQYTNKDLLEDRFGRLRELPLELASKNHEVYGLCISYRKKEEGKTLDGPVQWESINAGALKIPGLLRFLERASRLASKADIIWACSDSLYGIIGHILSLRYGIPLVFDLYDNFEYFFIGRLPLMKQLYRRVVSKCDAVTCVSQPLARLVRSYGRKEGVFVLENAVNRDVFKPLDKKTCRDTLGLPQNVRLVGTAGSLDRRRGIPFLFEAFHMLAKKRGDLHLVVAGPRTLPIPQGPRIHDLGVLPLEKVPLFLNALDVGVICNRNDDFGKYCFPQKAREIMACNVPLIAAAVGSMKELLENHSEWLFCPDDAKDLAWALENRFRNAETDYGDVPSWSDAATGLERIFLDLIRDQLAK